MNASTIFVFGWSGYIGGALVERLNDLGVRPMLVGRRSDSDILFSLDNATLDFVTTLKEGDKFIFLSAISSPDYCAKNYAEAYRINVTNTSLLISALLDRGVDVLFASSDVVYGKTVSPVTEGDHINPQFAYAEMKSEIEDRFRGNEHFKVMRLSYVWSLNDKFTRFLQNSHADQSVVEVFHPFIRAVICLDDVIDFVIAFAFSKVEFPSIVNLAGPEFLSRVQMVEAFSKHKSIKYVIKHLENDFFIYRPEQILMRSICLEQVLGHAPMDVLAAIHAKLSDGQKE